MVQVLIIMMVEIDISGGVGVGVGVVSARAVPSFSRTRKMTIKEKRRHRKLGHVFYLNLGLRNCLTKKWGTKRNTEMRCRITPKYVLEICPPLAHYAKTKLSSSV